MKTLSEIQQEVGLWSEANFGNQRSKTVGVALRELAPLLGIVEEVGEFNEAINNGDTSEMEDAIGDMLVYLCDYTYRSGCTLEDEFPTIGISQHLTLPCTVGRLCHCVLKRHQGIRQFAESSYFQERRKVAINDFLVAVNHCCQGSIKSTPMEILNRTWKKVSKRDWKASPEGPKSENP